MCRSIPECQKEKNVKLRNLKMIYQQQCVRLRLQHNMSPTSRLIETDYTFTTLIIFFLRIYFLNGKIQVFDGFIKYNTKCAYSLIRFLGASVSLWRFLRSKRREKKRERATETSLRPAAGWNMASTLTRFKCIHSIRDEWDRVEGVGGPFEPIQTQEATEKKKKN